jgi:hypothetical protein
MEKILKRYRRGQQRFWAKFSEYFGLQAERHRDIGRLFAFPTLNIIPLKKSSIF